VLFESRIDLVVIAIEVGRESRNQVDMDVRDGLAGCQTVL
jgi:hypothetical protein